MNKKLLMETIISCIVGVVLWGIIDLIICAMRNTNFVDTFFSPENLVELVIVMCISGFAYYSAKKNKK